MSITCCAPRLRPPTVWSITDGPRKRGDRALDCIGTRLCRRDDDRVFRDKGRALLVNEIAPRVHNSGHWTIEGCLHVAVRTAHPGGGRLAARTNDAWMAGYFEMLNLIGEDAVRLAHASQPIQTRGSISTAKRDVRAGRKMGHVNRRIAKA